MKKKVLAMLCCMAMAAAALTGCGGNNAAQTGAETGTGTEAPTTSGGSTKIALITMDSMTSTG